MKPKPQDLKEMGLNPIVRWARLAQQKQAKEPSTKSSKQPLTSNESSPSVPLSQISMDALSQLVANCHECKLCENRINPAFGRGDVSTGQLLLVGEGPGEEEDKQGTPFVGRAGKLLDSMLSSISLDGVKGVYITNVVKCRPPDNRNPQEDEIAACMPYLARQIELLKPRLIVTLGKVASNAMLRNKFSMRDMRGKKHDFNGLPLLAHYHPAYLLRSPTAKRLAWHDWLETRRLLDEANP